MRLLLPQPAAPGDTVDAVDVLDIYDVDRGTPPGPPRPWVTLDMVTSVDGATHAAGRSAGLSGPADKAVFRALRCSADAVLVAAGTARTEGYGPARPGDADRERRATRGRPPVPPIVVVSRSGDLDASAPLFVDAPTDARTVVAVPTDARDGSLEALAAVADVVRIGVGSVDLRGLLEELHGRGVRHVVCEGGPSLNGQLLAQDLIDEICGTIAPLCVGGPSPRMLGDPTLGGPLAVRLAHLAEEDGWLFPRWVRADAAR